MGRTAALWAIVPAKDPAAAKTRLSAVLSPDDRARLARRLLAGTVGAARQAPSLAGVLVVSGGATMRELAAQGGAVTLADPPPGERDPMNAALASALEAVAALGATAALILSADLPLLSAATIEEFIDEAGDAAVAIAADRLGRGTNALLLRPPQAIPLAFGPDSCVRHRTLARQRGLPVATVHLPPLAFDLDTPDDLILLGPEYRREVLHVSG